MSRSEPNQKGSTDAGPDVPRAGDASTVVRPAPTDEPDLPPVAVESSRAVGSPGNSLSQGGSASIRIGDYELLGEIARGGMGVVYKARQLGINRIVALKMTLTGQFAGEEERRRFLAEAEAAGGLDHPHIVPIYEIGQHEGNPFFSMGYVEGQSLKALVANGPLPSHRAAELMQTIAAAVHYAHTRGVIHRDLKPANVLLDAGGQPRVTDFGLAKQATTDSSLTATGQVLGTPGFMPPEQAAGRTAEIGPAADVYALGAMLYCLLTGRPPFQAATVVDTLRQVLEQDVVSPRRLNADVPTDLELVCLKCLEKRREDRYETASALADDLRRVRVGESVSIRSPGIVGRFRRTLDRNRDDVELAGWGRILRIFAVIVLVSELAVWRWGWQNKRQFERLPFIVRIAEFAAFGAVLWAHRRIWWPLRSAAARHMWSQWIAFFTACNLFVAATALTDWLDPGSAAHCLKVLFPAFAVVSGMMWFSLGSSFWGYCYVVGGAFFTLSLLMTVSPNWAPVEFGVLWSLSLWGTGRRLRRLAASERGPPLR